MTDAPLPAATCANCGAPLAGQYCGACGQSRDALTQPVVVLAFDWLGDIFTWDGRLWRTVRTLFQKPGRVARGFADGKRASYSPPIRLFLLSTVLLLAVMTAFDMRLITVSTRGVFVPAGGDESALIMPRPGGIHLGISADAEDGTAAAALTISLLGVGGGASNTITPEIVARIVPEAQARGVADFFISAISDPESVETAVNTAATQALFAMVVAFVLMNALLHPRRRVLEHAIHAFYFHAAVALMLTAWVPIAHFLPISRSVVALSAFALFSLGAILFDRGFYGTTALGLLWRMPLLLVGYCVLLGLILIGFTVLLIPR